MKKLYFLLGIFALLIFAGSAKANDLVTFIPASDYNCYSGEGYNTSLITCTRATFGEYNNTISVGDDVFVSNTDLKGIFIFNNTIPANESVVNAQFCGYVNYGFCDQLGNSYLPCSIGDINASHFIATTLSMNESYWNSTSIGAIKVFQQGYPPANPVSVPFAYVCINVTDWVQNDRANGRNLTAIRLSPTLQDNNPNANFLRMPSSTASSNQPYLQIEYSTEAQNYNKANPLWDANCYSGGNYDYGFVNCSTSGNPEQGSGYANTISVGNDVYFFYTDLRGLFTFNTTVPAGSNITNATFCGYVDFGFCNQNGQTYFPCQVGDINASQFIPNSLSNPSISDYNSTNISTTKIFMPSALSGTGVSGWLCINVTDWLQNNTANGRNTTGVRLAITQYIEDSGANFLRMPSHSSSSTTLRPYLYYEWEEAVPIINETYNITWVSPVPNNSIINSRNQITWTISAEEVPIYCYLNINGTGNTTMSINLGECSYTSTSLANGTYCGQVTASDIDETNTSYVQCASISYSPLPPSPINNLGLFSGVALLLMGAGVLLFLLEGLFGSASEMLRDPKKLVTIIIGGVILVAVLSALL